MSIEAPQLYLVLLRSGPGKEEEALRLLRSLVFGTVPLEGVELVAAYTLVGLYEAVMLVKSGSEDSLARFVSRLEKVLGSKVVIERAKPLTPGG
ncbi:MAG: hypothetical protein C4339_01980 [Nitrososphaerota archaeon]